MSAIPGRLTALRALMAKHNLQAYIVPSEDAHQSEYVADFLQRRPFISGFDGSAGTVVVGDKRAYLWTDGRYSLQASMQLSKDFWDVTITGPGVAPFHEDLATKFSKDARIGVDANCLSISMAEQLDKSLNDKGIQLVKMTDNLVDQIWEDRPSAPCQPVRIQPMKYAGQSHIEKLKNLRDALESEGGDAIVLSALDEIAWLLNMRGKDVDYNPVFISHALVSKDDAYLFMDSEMSEQVMAHLSEAGVEVKSYASFFDTLRSQCRGKTVLSDFGKTNSATQEVIQSVEGTVKKITSPVEMPKAIKNEVELKGQRDAHIRDGVALCKFLRWLENTVAQGNEIDEVQASEKLESLRREYPEFVSPSFATIAGSAENGAIIHYHPRPGACSKIKNDAMFLCDSGAQYVDGTTDVTRTIHFGTPSEHERRCFTRVLQGHIALSNAYFPEGITGHQLDIFARSPLWKDGLDFRHGTGHGVGSHLNVHEGPHSISFYKRGLDPALRSGMLVTNEPGYYEDGAFGIRIENVCEVVEIKPAHNFGGKKYLQIQSITMAPIERKLIDASIMSSEEIAWLDTYHQQVWDCLSGLMTDDGDKQWLRSQTLPLLA